jgi:hypothetical protein
LKKRKKKKDCVKSEKNPFANIGLKLQWTKAPFVGIKTLG